MFGFQCRGVKVSHSKIRYFSELLWRALGLDDVEASLVCYYVCADKIPGIHII